MKNSVLVNIFPSVIMFIINLLSFGNVFRDSKGTLIILYPLLFLIQGFLCGIKQMNFKSALVISTLLSFINIFLFMNDSAIIYPIVYLTFGVLGNSIGKFIRNVNQKAVERKK